MYFHYYSRCSHVLHDLLAVVCAYELLRFLSNPVVKIVVDWGQQ